MGYSVWRIGVPNKMTFVAPYDAHCHFYVARCALMTSSNHYQA
jgi:hypothetical protein